MLKQVFLLALVVSCLSCDHPVYCTGDIIKAVSDSNLFADSKTFVDKPLAYPVETVLQSFSQNSSSLADFIAKNFLSEDILLEEATLADWKEKPVTFTYIKDPLLRDFAYSLNAKWKGLAKKFTLSKLYSISKCRKNCSTILEVLENKTMIVPGGRFRESYYWDTYWIVKGLIQSEMLATAQAVIRNFFLVIDEYGYVPNGFRIYYLGRSQPPFLALMVQELAQVYRLQFKSAQAVRLQLDALPRLLKEHSYWMTTHNKSVVVNGTTYTLNHYNANNSGPRPQSYREDLRLTANFTQSRRQQLLRNISSAAESGWDFSTRWMDSTRALNSTRTTELIPSDLNTVMGLMESVIANIGYNHGNSSLYIQFSRYRKDRQSYFKNILERDIYPDYPGQLFYASSIYPYILLNKTLPISFGDLVSPAASYVTSGQQWDYPNVWAPNVWALYTAYGSNYKQALNVAQKWIDTVYCGFKQHSAMFEKYHAEKLGERGEGGEYVVQEGFGWTNGLTLELLLNHGIELVAPACPNNSEILQ